MDRKRNDQCTHDKQNYEFNETRYKRALLFFFPLSLIFLRVESPNPIPCEIEAQKGKTNTTKIHCDGVLAFRRWNKQKKNHIFSIALTPFSYERKPFIRFSLGKSTALLHDCAREQRKKGAKIFVWNLERIKAFFEWQNKHRQTDRQYRNVNASEKKTSHNNKIEYIRIRVPLT